MKIVYGIFSAMLTIISFSAFGQGPPITADKPIMLGGKSIIVKTLTEIRYREDGTFSRAPLMLHYLPTSNSLVAVHTPLVIYDGNKGDQGFGTGTALGDIALLGKYQFFRKDGTAKTFRMVVKTIQTLPTGKDLGIQDISLGEYQGYLALVAGYESIKFGISGEIGYNLIPGRDLDELRTRLGFGLPLLKPTYPVNQINLYFEYQQNWFPEAEIYELFYAQGIQYAIKRLTLEAAVQVPFVQTGPDERKLRFGLFFGTRYIF